ncbi:uncharacterized protein LOC143251550 [Tachypleus tridentatus]|uniref:uncharacterized protein LOC143251550 n=1 Tax=Tachypleus tridentatus TaxID=6853 RepID=UPI003FD18236
MLIDASSDIPLSSVIDRILFLVFVSEVNNETFNLQTEKAHHKTEAILFVRDSEDKPVIHNRTNNEAELRRFTNNTDSRQSTLRKSQFSLELSKQLILQHVNAQETDLSGISTTCCQEHVEVLAQKDGSYIMTFTMTQTGHFWLHVRVNGQYIKGSPFPLIVYPPGKRHSGLYHCCSFCSSGGSRDARCACNGKMPDATEAGFFIRLEKSVWSLTQYLVHLDVFFNAHLSHAQPIPVRLQVMERAIRLSLVYLSFTAEMVLSLLEMRPNISVFTGSHSVISVAQESISSFKKYVEESRAVTPDLINTVLVKQIAENEIICQQQLKNTENIWKNKMDEEEIVQKDNKESIKLLQEDFEKKLKFECHSLNISHQNEVNELNIKFQNDISAVQMAHHEQFQRLAEDLRRHWEVEKSELQKLHAEEIEAIKENLNRQFEREKQIMKKAHIEETNELKKVSEKSLENIINNLKFFCEEKSGHAVSESLEYEKHSLNDTNSFELLKFQEECKSIISGEKQKLKQKYVEQLKQEVEKLREQFLEEYKSFCLTNREAYEKEKAYSTALLQALETECVKVTQLQLAVESKEKNENLKEMLISSGGGISYLFSTPPDIENFRSPSTNRSLAPDFNSTLQVTSLNETKPTETFYKAYCKYRRAENYRRSLVYQKKYLLNLLNGFQTTEIITMALLAKIIDEPTDNHQTILSPVSSFRSVAYAIIALHRMHYLVKRWKKALYICANSN